MTTRYTLLVLLAIAGATVIAMICSLAKMPAAFNFLLGGLFGGWLCALQARLIFGWRWHFRMTRAGQWLLKVAHREGTPGWAHDLIEAAVYGRDGLR